jgi:hypothetical protein
MADGRLDTTWDQTAALLAQVSNMRTWVFRTDKKQFAPIEWNPRRRGQIPKRELQPGGMEALKTMVLSGNFKGRR